MLIIYSTLKTYISLIFKQYILLNKKINTYRIFLILKKKISVPNFSLINYANNTEKFFLTPKFNFIFNNINNFIRQILELLMRGKFFPRCLQIVCQKWI